MYNNNGALESHFRIAIVIATTIVCLSASIILAERYIIKGREAVEMEGVLGTQGSDKIKESMKDVLR